MQDTYSRLRVMGLVINTMAICVTLKHFLGHLSAHDRRKDTKQQVEHIASDATSYSRACETDLIVDDQTNKMKSMTVSMCADAGDDNESINWSKLSPFRDTLRTLRVEKNDFVTVDMERINKLRVLEEFVLRENEYLDSLDSLPTMPSLRTLRIVENGITQEDTGMAIVDIRMSTLTNLVHLQICNCNLPNTGIPIVVFGFPSLLTVDFSSNTGGNTDITQARWSQSLQRISLENTMLTGTPNDGMFGSATHVHLSYNNLSGKISMCNTSKTEVLEATHNNIDGLHIDSAPVKEVRLASQKGELVLDLRSTQSLKTLDVSRNRLCVKNMKDVGCERLIMNHLVLEDGLMIPHFHSLVVWGALTDLDNMNDNGIVGGNMKLESVVKELANKKEISFGHPTAHLLVRQPLAMILWLIASGPNQVSQLIMEGAYREGMKHTFHTPVMREILKLGTIPSTIVIDPVSKSKLNDHFDFHASDTLFATLNEDN